MGLCKPARARAALLRPALVAFTLCCGLYQHEGRKRRFLLDILKEDWHEERADDRTLWGVRSVPRCAVSLAVCFGTGCRRCTTKIFVSYDMTDCSLIVLEQGDNKRRQSLRLTCPTSVVGLPVPVEVLFVPCFVLCCTLSCLDTRGDTCCLLAVDGSDDPWGRIVWDVSTRGNGANADCCVSLCFRSRRPFRQQLGSPFNFLCCPWNLARPEYTCGEVGRWSDAYSAVLFTCRRGGGAQTPQTLDGNQMEGLGRVFDPSTTFEFCANRGSMVLRCFFRLGLPLSSTSFLRLPNSSSSNSRSSSR